MPDPTSMPAAATRHPLEDPRALQILLAEHASLTATRSMSWNEVFSRTSIFFTSVSAAAVALALVGQATAFGTGFTVFALVMLPVVLFLGVATLVRLGQANNEDVRWVFGLNRLRGAYAELVPGIEELLVTGSGGGGRAIVRTFGFEPAGGSDVGSVFHGLVTAPAIVGVVDAVIAASIVGLAATVATASVPVAVVAGVATLVAGVAASVAYGRRMFLRQVRMLERLEAEHRERRAAWTAPGR